MTGVPDTPTVFEIISPDPILAGNDTIRQESTQTMEENFVVGAQSTEDEGVPARDQKMLFIANSANAGAGSFRAGVVTGTQWNDASRGAASVAFGSNNTASGAQSASLGGSANVVAGLNSVCCGGTTHDINATSSNAGIVCGVNNRLDNSDRAFV